MASNPYQQTIQTLLVPGGHRVWSLMVSLFGDLAQKEGTAIDGPTLSAVMAEMQIRPEAVRVALHRLRNEGWIVSEKSGRTRRHALTPKSRARSAAASERIYTGPALKSDGWHLVLVRDADTIPPEKMRACGFVQLLPRVFVGAVSAVPPKAALVLPGDDVPAWMRAQIAPAMQTQDYQALLPILTSADKLLRDTRPSPLQRAVLRCLIVHNWRRIVLRHPPLPRNLLPDGWEGHSCHMLVNRLLVRFPKPDPAGILPQ